VEILRLHGAEIEAHWQQLASLRIEIFRDYPYLYEGSLEYEHDYLKTYWQSPQSRVVLVFDQGEAVGATTSLPLLDEQPEFRQPFAQPEKYFYLGESVLKPAYRGRRLGHLFFDEREDRARQLGFEFTCFCAVQRSPEQEPPGTRSLQDFWQKRGYQHHPQLRCRLSWTDVGQTSPSDKELSFWIRAWPLIDSRACCLQTEPFSLVRSGHDPCSSLSCSRPASLRLATGHFQDLQGVPGDL
jgi:GNAT superfamily N-acetyltransferase